MGSYRQHAWRHHPTKGTDPIEIPAIGGVPSIATYYFTRSDTPLTVPPTDLSHLSTNIPWPHSSLPSTGEVSEPLVGNPHIIEFNVDCITIEFLQTQWDDGGYNKAAVLGTDSGIWEADQYSLDTAGAGTAAGSFVTYGDSTNYVRPNIHSANDTMHAYTNQEDTVDHDMLAAYLVIFIWSIDGLGYSGGIPGWPQ